MSRLIVLLLVHACVLVGSLPAQEPPRLEPDAIVSRLAFGSCARQNRPQPIWKTIAATKPQLFVWTGDIIYADTENMDVMRKKWAKLQAIAGYARLRRTTPILATWDDHDYGRNDAGADYARREASQQIFLDAFGVPKDSPRRTRAGVYHAETYGPVGKRLQVILLDTRYHRSPLQRFEGKRSGYRPLGEQHATMLGEDQWAWLEERLREPADLRLIVSSIQFVSEEHRFEKWNNLYRERRRMERLIRTTGARGVVFLSGDRHHAEISRWHRSQGYPLIDITASGMTGGGAKNGLPILRSREANRHRVGPVVFGPHFGQVDIDWERPDPLVTLSIVMQDGSAPLVHRVALSELSGEPRGDAALVDRYRTAGVDPEIVTDGDTADWPAGQNLLVTADHLHFRFRTPTLRSLGTGPRPIEIGFDLDGKSDTGVPAGGVTGADLRLTVSPPSRNGRRQWWPNVERREGADMVPVDAGEIGLSISPVPLPGSSSSASTAMQERSPRSARRERGRSPRGPVRSPKSKRRRSHLARAASTPAPRGPRSGRWSSPRKRRGPFAS